MSTYGSYKNPSMSSLSGMSAEEKRKLLQQNMVNRIAAANNTTPEQLATYGNNADLLKQAANGASVTLAVPSYTSQPQPVVDSYEQYLNNAATSYGNIYNNAVTANANAKQATYAEAERERQRGVVDAQSAYAQNKATYGAKAEALGGMGLSGSGYSDYLESQAYATQRGEIQGANAQASYTKRIADQTEQQANLEAQNTYQNALLALEEKKAAYQQQKAAEEKALEAQQQTTYYSILEGIANGTINKDNIDMYLNNSDLSDTSKNSLATYAGNKVNTSGLETSLAAYEASKDFVNAAISYVDLNYPDATDEQKKTFQADYIVNHISEIDDSKLSEYAKKISNGDYGTAGGEAIKKAVSQTYIDSSDTLSKEELKTVIDSGILTTEAQSKLDTVYANKYGETKQEQVSIATENASEIFGKFAGSNDPKSEQSIYIRAVEEMVSNGNISEGEYIAVNYGNALNQKYYKYLGNGKFEKASEFDAFKGTIRTPAEYEFDKGKRVVSKKK